MSIIDELKFEKKGKNETLTLRVPEKYINKLKGIADEKEVSPNFLVVTIIKHFFDNMES